MNELKLSENVGNLESAILNLVYLNSEESLINPNNMILDNIKECINNIFVDSQIVCNDVLFTNNTDKPYFGLYINPLISKSDIITILLSDEKIKLTNYQIEFDSKLFDLELSGIEIVSYILHEISSMINSYKAIDDVRALMNLHLLSNDNIINIRDSVNFSQLMIFAIKDTLYKVSSILFKETDEEISDNLVLGADLLDFLISARNKICSSPYGLGDVVKTPKPVILQWVFSVYSNIKLNFSIAKDTLENAKDFTGSKLKIREIDNTIKAIEQFNFDTITESVSLNKLFEKNSLFSLNEISIFKSLKNNGLRSIEDSLWEYKLLIKNCDTEEDAMYILHGISTRLSILKDYIHNTPDLPEAERKHWESVIEEFYSLREQLAKKRIVNKKQYGLFFDYDQLDYLDQNNKNNMLY